MNYDVIPARVRNMLFSGNDTGFVVRNTKRVTEIHDPNHPGPTKTLVVIKDHLSYVTTFSQTLSITSMVYSEKKGKGVTDA